MNFFEQGISLGRWFGVRVIIHWLFLLWAANELFTRSGEVPLWVDSLWIALLFTTVLVHEFGHALSCKAMGGDAEHIVLWPLGGVAFVKPPMNPTAWLVTTACGPLVNAILWPAFWAINRQVIPVLPLDHESPAFQVLAVGCIMMEQINRGLLLFNLVPAYPMDGGRLLQEMLWFFLGLPRSLLISGMVGTVAGGCLIILGLGLTTLRIPLIDFSIGIKGHVNWMLAVIGLMCMMNSFGIYRQAQVLKGYQKN